MANPDKYFGVKTKKSVALDNDRPVIPKALQRALIASEEKMRETYETGSEITQIVNASARREVAHTLLTHVKRLVKHINLDKFSDATAADQARIVKAYVETLERLSENFKADQKKAVGDLSDAELQALASKEKNKKPN